MLLRSICEFTTTLRMDYNWTVPDSDSIQCLLWNKLKDTYEGNHQKIL